MTSAVLERELQTFEEHREELVGTSRGKFVLIHDGDIVGTFESKKDAIGVGYRTLGNVPFLVKEVVPVDTPLDFLHRYSDA